MNIIKLVQACLILVMISLPESWCYETNINTHEFFEPNCNVIGVCKVKLDLSIISYNWIIITYSSQQGYVLQQETVYSIETCSNLCINTLNCKWFSFSQSLEFCELFDQCSEIDPNPSFLSSQVDCKYELDCNVIGVCKVKFNLSIISYNWIIIPHSTQQGYVLHQETVYNIETCSDVCISNPNCSWFSFSQSLEFCILFDQCSEIDPDPSFLSSQVDCKYEGGKLFSYF